MQNDAAIQISEFEILPIKPKAGLIGFASFVLNQSFYVSNIAIHTRHDGNIRLVYPAKTLPNGKVVNLFHPITQFAGQLVLEEAENALHRLRR